MSKRDQCVKPVDGRAGRAAVAAGPTPKALDARADLLVCFRYHGRLPETPDSDS